MQSPSVHYLIQSTVSNLRFTSVQGLQADNTDPSCRHHKVAVIATHARHAISLLITFVQGGNSKFGWTRIQNLKNQTRFWRFKRSTLRQIGNLGEFGGVLIHMQTTETFLRPSKWFSRYLAYSMVSTLEKSAWMCILEILASLAGWEVP